MRPSPSKQRKSRKKIADIYRKILACVECKFMVSKRGVPLLYTPDNYSFVYFLSQRRVKVFNNFQQNKPQTCWTFKHWGEAVDFYHERTGNFVHGRTI